MLPPILTRFPLPWTESHEAFYHRVREIRTDSFAGKKEYPGAIERKINDVYGELQFSRLCHYLRQRQPDAFAGYSILIFQLSAEEVELLEKEPVIGFAVSADSPEHVRILAEMGGVELDIDNLESAQKFYEAVLRVEPEHYLANHNAGTIFFKQGKLEEARQRFEKAVRIRPDKPASLANLLAIHVQLKEYDQALEIAERGIKLFPNNPALKQNAEIARLRKNAANAHQPD